MVVASALPTIGTYRLDQKPGEDRLPGEEEVAVMRKIVRTLAVLSVGGLMALPSWPAQATVEQIPTTCQTHWVHEPGWDVNGKTLSEFEYLPDGRLWHHGDGWARGNGDVYCQGFWYVDGHWVLNEATMEGELWGTIRMELGFANIDGGFEASYTGQFVFEGDTIWEGELSGQGYGELQSWQIWMTVWNGEIWTGYVIPSGG